MKTKITLTNEFHLTSCTLIVDMEPDQIEVPISGHQYRRAQRALCGMADCHCGGLPYGEWKFDEIAQDKVALVHRGRERMADYGY